MVYPSGVVECGRWKEIKGRERSLSVGALSARLRFEVSSQIYLLGTLN
jgi:hypothetical protein